MNYLTQTVLIRERSHRYLCHIHMYAMDTIVFTPPIIYPKHKRYSTKPHTTAFGFWIPKFIELLKKAAL